MKVISGEPKRVGTIMLIPETVKECGTLAWLTQRLGGEPVVLAFDTTSHDGHDQHPMLWIHPECIEKDAPIENEEAEEARLESDHEDDQDAKYYMNRVVNDLRAYGTIGVDLEMILRDRYSIGPAKQMPMPNYVQAAHAMNRSDDQTTARAAALLHGPAIATFFIDALSLLGDAVESGNGRTERAATFLDRMGWTYGPPSEGLTKS